MKKGTIAVALAAFVLMSGCASEDSARSSLVGRCSVEGAGWAIGKPADETNGRMLFRQSGAGLWRIITPDKAVLADYRDDRLNVHVDALNRITRVTCG